MTHGDWTRGSSRIERIEAPPPAGAAYHAAAVAALVERRTALEAALAELQTRAGALAEVAARLVEALRTGGKVLAAGNGGSAAEAQHFTAELVGRFKRERLPYAALSLATDTAALTAIANDYGYAEVFARQVRALGQRGDVFVAFSTSGESENLVRAARAARAQGLTVVAVTGERQSRLGRAADLAVRVPLRDTALIQELHMAVTHILCDLAEAALAADEQPGTDRVGAVGPVVEGRVEGRSGTQAAATAADADPREALA